MMKVSRLHLGNLQDSGSLVSFPGLPKEQTETHLLTSAQDSLRPLGGETVSLQAPGTEDTQRCKLNHTERNPGHETTPLFS